MHLEPSVETEVPERQVRTGGMYRKGKREGGLIGFLEVGEEKGTGQGGREKGKERERRLTLAGSQRAGDRVRVGDEEAVLAGSGRGASSAGGAARKKN